MTQSKRPQERIEQEDAFLNTLFNVEEATFTTENSKKYKQVCEEITSMIKGGFNVNEKMQTEDLEGMTPLGLFNAMSLDLPPQKGERRPDDMRVGEEKEAIKNIHEGYKAVVMETLSQYKSIDMSDGSDVTQDIGLILTKSDPQVIGACLEVGLPFNVKALSGIEQDGLSKLCDHPAVLNEIKALGEGSFIHRSINDVPNLLLLNKEELDERLNSPVRELMTQQNMDHAFHCAVSSMASVEKLEVWLKAGSSPDGIDSNLFNKSALGSAIFASQLHDIEGTAANAKVEQGVAKMVSSIGNDPDDDANDNSNDMQDMLAQVMAGAGQGAGQGAQQKEKSAVELLVEYGADVNLMVGPTSPLAQAYEKGSLEIIDLLKKNGADFANDEEKEVAMIRCAELGSTNAIKKLMDEGVSLDVVVSKTTKSMNTDIAMVNEHTPLTMAAMMGKADTVDFLLKNNADPEKSVQRVVSEAMSDKTTSVNFIKEAIRLDQPHVLEVAVDHLGIDRVKQESLEGAKNCTAWMGAKKAAAAIPSLSTKSPAP